MRKYSTLIMQYVKRVKKNPFRIIQFYLSLCTHHVMQPCQPNFFRQARAGTECGIISQIPRTQILYQLYTRFVQIKLGRK